MAKPLYKLTPEDEQILELGKKNGSYLSSFYFRSFDKPRGFEFDHKISPPWQLDCHHTGHLDIVVIGGWGASKTLGIGMSAVTWATELEGFKFLNVAPTAWQSKQMYDKIMEQATDTIFAQRFLYKFVLKPYPTITIKYKTAKGATHFSTLEFMSAGDDAQNILTWEGDWCNVDQAEAIDNLTDLWSNLGSRVRGSTKAGRKKMGRLSALANADDNPELWALARLAEDFPETNKFYLVPTGSNKNLSESDINSFKRRLGFDPERIKQHLEAVEPRGKGKEFSRELVEGCIDPGMDAEFDHNIALGTLGFEKGVTREAETMMWQMPRDSSRSYVVVGDPGQGHAPLRNAPTVMVFDVTEFPDGPATLRGFWWGDGHGSYEPWITQFMYWNDYFHCINGAFDATGGQKIFSERVFEDFINILPVDLSNMKKRSCMVTLKLTMMKKLLRIPGEIKGLTSQLLKYRMPDEKIPQDVVATLFILAGWLRAMGYEIPGDDANEEPPESPALENRYSRMGVDRYARVISRT